MSRVAVLGLGAMGARIAQRLLAAGHAVCVWNRSPAALTALCVIGAEPAPTPRAALIGAEFALSLLRDDEASRSVWFDPHDGALAGLAGGAIALEASTLSPALARELAAAVDARGAGFLDVPVVGSRPQAEAGTLVTLAGGDASVLERARPLLAAYSARVHHAGAAAGAGMALKLAVNALFALQAGALAEIGALLLRQGLDLPASLEAINALPVASPLLAALGAQMLADRHEPLFPLELALKDLRYASAAAGANRLLSAAEAQFAEAAAAGLGPLQLTAVRRLYRWHA